MKVLFNFALSILLFFSVTAIAELPLTPYAQFSSNQTQLTNPLSFSQVVLENRDGAQGIVLNEAKNGLIIQEAGTYFVLIAGQVGGREKQNATGYVDLWLQKNGKVLPNSNVRQATGPNFTTVLVSQSVLHLEAHDIISFAFSATRPSLGLIATPEMDKKPNVPSVIVSIFKI